MPEELTPAAIWSEYSPFIISFGVKVIGALLVLIIGLRIAGWLAGLVRREALKVGADRLGLMEAPPS